MNRIAYGMPAAAFLLIGCHTITEQSPTQPTSPTTTNPGSGILTVSIPAIPTSTPTPKPTTPTPAPSATPGPSPTPSPTPAPPDASGCGNPLPPAISRMNVKVHIRGPNKWTLDSTPLVHDGAYCAKVGFTDGRLDCPVRPEGAPDRVACETYAVGRAQDTGRPGPTWTRNGHLCTGASGDCDNHEDNQYLLYAYGGGVYEACTEDDVCGNVVVDR